MEIGELLDRMDRLEKKVDSLTAFLERFDRKCVSQEELDEAYLELEEMLDDAKSGLGKLDYKVSELEDDLKELDVKYGDYCKSLEDDVKASNDLLGAYDLAVAELAESVRRLEGDRQPSS